MERLALAKSNQNPMANPLADVGPENQSRGICWSHTARQLEPTLRDELGNQ